MVGALLVLALIATAYAFGVPRLGAHDTGLRVSPPRRAVALPPPKLPERIEQCETFTEQVCGTWTLRPDGTYRAEWDDGATATIRVNEFSGTHIWATRVDNDPRGVTADYAASVADGRVVGGSVWWAGNRGARTGNWSAEWEPRPFPRPGEDDFTRNSLARYQQQSDGGSRWTIVGGTLVGIGPAIQSVLLRKDARFADGWVETVSSRADDGGLVLRAQENGDYYLLAFRDDAAPAQRGSMNLAVYHHVGTAYHEMWTMDVPWPRGSPHTIRFQATGERLRVYWDGELRGDFPVSPRVNDHRPYTGAGLAGLRHYGDTAEWITSFNVFRWEAGRR